MINNFKTFEITDNDIKNLSNVNPYWNKILQKKIYNLNKWLKKFKQNNLSFEIILFKNYNEYAKMFKQINHFKSFLNQKYTLIKSDSKFLSKFKKMIADYSSLLGIIKAIEIICYFYEQINISDIPSKRTFAILLGNNCINKYLSILKKELDIILKNDKYVGLCYENIIKTKPTLTDSYLFLINIIKYNKILFKRKKIDKKIFLDINSLLIEFFAFTDDFIAIYLKFISGLS